MGESMREYRVLGPLAVVRDGTPVDLGSPKQRAVLAVLLLHRGAVVSRDRLIDAVWGDDPPAAADTSLQAYVSNLRRLLRDTDGEASPIQRVSPGYRLVVGDDTLDLAEFERFARSAQDARREQRWEDAEDTSVRAAALWNGGLLDEFGDRDWVSVTAAALHEVRLGVAEIHVTATLARGEVSGALGEIAALRSADSLRERGVWLHMIALYRAGRAGEALAVFTDHARVIADELGLDPGVELAELQAAILRRDPEIAAWPRPPHWSGAETAREPAAGRQSAVVDGPARAHPAPLVGREALVQSIRALYSPTRSGTRWFALVGPAGIGKTRLAQEASRLADENGERTVWMRCPDTEGIPAWWPLRQLCRALGADPDEVLSIPAGVDADTARFAVYERVQELLETASAGTPVTVVVDDVHWADPMTSGLLGYLASVTTRAHLTVVMTIREEETGPATVRLRSALIRAGGDVVVVPRLTLDEGVALVRTVTDGGVSSEDAAEIAERTGGNPLFVTEYARLSAGQRAETMPEAVRSVLGRRLDTLDPPVREVIGYAALLGEDIDVPFLARVMDRPPTDVADCLDEAADERIVVWGSSGGQPSFAHALLREQASSSLAPLRRCRMHMRIADVLDDFNGPGASQARAAHLLDALPVADVDTVVAACREAAKDATVRWDSENAAYWYGCALTTYESLVGGEADVAHRDELLVAMLDAYARAGRVQSVLDTVENRLRDAVNDGAADTAGRVARTLLRAGGGWPWMSPAEEPGPLHAVLEHAVDTFADRPDALVGILGALAIGHCYHHDGSVVAGLLKRADAAAAQLGDPAAAADAALARLITYSGVASHAHQQMDLARRIAAHPHPDADVDSVITDSVITMAALTVGDLQTTVAHLERAIAGSERMRLPVLRAQLRWMEMALAVWHADFDLARDHFRVAMAVHQQTELYVAGSGMLALMALAGQQGVGELIDEVLGTDEAGRMDWAAAVVAEAPENQVSRLMAAGVATVAWTQGDVATVRDMVDVWSTDDHPMFWTSLAQATVLADLVAELQLVDHAPRFLNYLTPFSGCIATVGQVGCVGPVDLAVARLHYLLDQQAEGDAALERAQVLCTSADSPSGSLRCRLVEISRAPHGPDRTAALESIVERARRLGLPRVEASALAFLADSGSSHG
ncbi:AAA family ATPase [Gordonia sp. PDNC005]|uniref:BTAD domain-containing putative transcriptional regulator n=1 Tax=unclassified Gordonia (in: high G+C Gram-positive bacteria) TaxID=2657482 RepID=UPI0019624946|nr:BTAD domain-containing putative transcriptional regulator [Gordonia sp. PDNC005]QRY61131.1 AAA family ATPase [Gordonia sp. PDNC005]